MGIILASSSPYRQALLSRLGVSFQTDSPAIDEAPFAGESATDLVARLSKAKAQAVLTRHPDAVVIGSDQVACLGDAILGKPGNIPNAIAQLSQCAGRQVTFLTGLCVADRQRERYSLSRTEVRFRRLTPEQIRRYVERELPLDCAGSFKCEDLGIALFEAITSDDPTSLIGLPLIQLTSQLMEFGLHPLD